jgi:hypothetical protein
MKFEIESRFNSSVLFSIETETLKLAVELAVKSGAYLGGAYLGGAYLEGAYLEGAYLGGAYLGGAHLEGAYLEGAYLRGAYLEGAYLGGAYLGGAYLEGAYLEGAYLRGAYLGGAYLGGAHLEGAYLEGKFPIQIGGHKHWLITHTDGDLQIGCHKHSIEWWQENAEKTGKREGYSALDIEIYKIHIEHIARISRLLWKTDEEKVPK